MFEIVTPRILGANIKVIGVGGCGGNAINHMIEKNIEGVEFICANTDAQALGKSLAKDNIQLGPNITRGLGAGANPEVGRQSAMEDKEKIKEAITGADMLFIAAGMGGGTGTGAAPVVAEIAKSLGMLCVAVVTKPFRFEGRRMRVAEAGLESLAENVDSLIVIPNDKLMEALGGECGMLEAFAAANDVLCGAVAGISEVINCPGLINVDFADVRAVMSEMGMAMMGSAQAAGEGRARRAAEAAVASPLLENTNLSGARGALVNVTGPRNLKIQEVHEAMEKIEEFTAPDAQVIVGTVIDETMEDEVRVTVIATGIGEPHLPRLSVVGADALRPEDAKDFAVFDTPTVLRSRRGRDDKSRI